MEEEGEAGAQSTTYTYTRVDSPAGLLDLPAGGLLSLSQLSVCSACAVCGGEEEVDQSDYSTMA